MEKIILSLFLVVSFSNVNAQNRPNNVKPVSVESAQENVIDAGIEFESKIVDYGVINIIQMDKESLSLKVLGQIPLRLKVLREVVDVLFQHGENKMVHQHGSQEKMVQ